MTERTREQVAALLDQWTNASDALAKADARIGLDNAAPDLARQLLAALARLAEAEGLLAEVGSRLSAARQTGSLNTGWHELERKIAALTPAEQALFDQSMAMREVAGEIAKEQME